MFFFSPQTLGKWSNFDDHIFQMGWFNHQLDKGCLKPIWMASLPGPSFQCQIGVGVFGLALRDPPLQGCLLPPLGGCGYVGNSRKTTLPKTNSSHLKMMVSKRNLLFQGFIFECYVSFREGNVSPENQWLVQMYFLLKFSPLFRGHVSFRGC